MGAALIRGYRRTHDSNTYTASQSSSSDLMDPCTAGTINMHNMESMKMSYELLKTITDDFSEDRILGSGTFGVVYKGVNANEDIAVKLFRIMTGLEDVDFTNEFQNLARLKHQNIVKLVGYCNESEKQIVQREDGSMVTAEKMHMALCFEYVDNGSLNQHILDENQGLDWHIRYKIIRGICEGLKYLREGLEKPIWHLDLKPENILLDKEMTPKIADFGLSRLIGDERTRRALKSIGTCGYWPPEYVRLQLFSSAFDIFSLGVIITKIMIGKEGYFRCADMPPRQLVKHVGTCWRKRLQETVKPGSLDTYCKQVRACIEIASKCLKEDRKQRPTIQEILVTLNGTETGTPASIVIEQPHDGESLLPSSRRVTFMSCPGKDCEGSRFSYTENRPECLPYQHLRTITNNFSKARLLGEGWYGRVYRGVYKDGRVIAVKVLKPLVLQNNDVQLRAVIEEHSKVNHENIMPLLAYSEETESITVQQNNGKYVIADQRKLVLCFEYLQNGSLEQHISYDFHGLDWCTCYKIIKGTCDGLRYLHEGLPTPILHMNLKPSNILLDENMVPKITDFGMSRLFGEQETRKTISFFGTMGDLPPEFITKQILTQQYDIYSLGVIILKMITGNKSAYSSCSMTSRMLIDSVLERWTQRLHKTLDGRSVEGYRQQVKRCIEIALKCVEADRHKRPNIGDVVRMLDETETLIHDKGNKLLDVHKMEVTLGPEKYVTCSLQLCNNEDDGVAFRLVTKFQSNYLTKLPLYGIVSPRCTYILILMTQEPHWLLRGDASLVLQSMAVSYHQELRLQDHDQASVVREYENLFDQAQETASVEVQEVMLKSAWGSSVFAHELTNWQFLSGLADSWTNPLGFPAEEASFKIIPSQNAQQVLSIDVHPIEPWIMTTHLGGNLRVWDYNKMVVLDSIIDTKEQVYIAKFIAREKWVVAGDGNGYIYVYSYYDKQDTTSFKAHNGRILSLAVHTSDPYVLSSSHNDHQIKLWKWDQYCDFENSWVCHRIFEGHRDKVSQVIFSPEDNCSFASASWDCTVKIWSLSTDACNTFTLGKHPDGLICVDYIISDDHQHLITGSKDGTAQIWDMETKSCSEYLIGHAHHVSVVYSHPELPKLITGSIDGTVRIWDSTTYRLENIIAFNLGAVYCFGYIDKLQRTIVGCHQGIAMMEITMTHSIATDEGRMQIML